MKAPTAVALAAATELTMKYPKAFTGGVCAYTAADREDGKELKIPYRNHANSDVCHAGLSSLHRTNPGCLVINAHKADWQKKNREFLKWCCTEAPFTHGVLNKDDLDLVLGHGTIIDMGEVGVGGALWLCKAVRHFTEDTWVPGTWSKLRDCGLDGFQAFVGADILSADGSPKGPTHTGLFQYGTPTQLRKAYDFIRDAKLIDNTGARQGGGASAYYSGGDIKVWGSLQGKEVKQPDGWGGFTMVAKPCSPQDYAAQLKEIFEGDPKNVK